MSEIVKQRKYHFVSSVKMPNLEEIIEAASDFSTPTDKKILVGEEKKKDISQITKQATMSKEQLELQKLGIQVADAEIERAKQKELARAEELRRLCKEREMMAQKRAEEEAMKADDGTTAKKKEVTEEDLPTEMSSVPAPLDTSKLKALGQLPPLEETKTEEPYYEDLSAVAENPFDESAPAKKKEPAEKKEFQETVLEDDYTEKMDFLDDSSESVDDDFLDF